ncbi:MAG: PAS domain S-box protein [Thermoleophilia bacterium]|nr:PAS domain S-box protein [Thermoleophilia bacterium]
MTTERIARRAGGHAALLRALPHPVLILTRDLVVADMSPAAAEALGVGEEAIGAGLEAVGVRWRSPLAAAEALRRAAAGATPAATPVLTTGAGRSLAAVLSPLEGPGGEPAGVVATLLADPSATGPAPGLPAGVLAEDGEDAMATLAADGRVISVSPAIEAITGRPPEALVGREVFANIHPEDVEAARAAHRALVSGERREGVLVVRVAHAQRGTAWIEVRLRPAPEGDPEARVLLQVRDVTARAEADRRLADSEARYRLLAEHTSDLILRLSPEGVVTYASPAAWRLLGREPADLEGRPLTEAALEDDRPALAEALTALPHVWGSLRTRGRWRRVDGTPVWMDTALRAVRTDGRIVEVVASAREVGAEVDAEQALAASEERFRLLVGASADVIFRIDPDATIIDVSESVCDLLGRAPEDLIGTHGLDLVHPDDAEASGVARARALDGEPWRVRMRFRTADGGWVWTSVHHRAARGADGRGEIQAVAREITQEIEAEDRLRESEARFRLLAEHGADMVAVVTPDGTVAYASQAARRLIGGDPESITGVPFADLVHPGDRPAVDRLIAGLGRGPDSGALRLRLRRPDGGEGWVEMTHRVVRGEDREPSEVVCALRDIGLRMAAEQALADAEARLRLLVGNMSDVITRFALDGTVIDVVGDVEGLLGMTREELVGRPSMAFVDPEWVMANAPQIRVPTEVGVVQTIVLRGRRADGSRLWIESRQQGVAGPDGVIAEVVATSRDVTARVEAEQALRESEDLHRSLVEAMAEGAIVLYADGRPGTVNAAAKRILGLEEDEILGRGNRAGAWEEISPDGRVWPPEEHPVMVALTTGERVSGAIMGVRAGAGRRLWLRISAVPLIAPGAERPYAALATFADVTAEREADQVKRLLAEQSSDLIARHRADYSLEWVSPSSARILGWAPDELIALATGELVHPDDAAAAAGPPRGEEGPTRFRVRHKAGHWVWAEVTSRPVLGERGEVIAFHSALRDVGAQVAAEQALHESEDRLRTLVGSMAEGAIVRYADGRRGTANAAAVQILGADQDEILGRGPLGAAWGAVRADGAHCLPGEEPAAVALREGRAIRGRVMGITVADGRRRWLRVSAEPMSAPGEPAPYGVVTTFADVTAEREAAGIARLMAEQASDVLSRHRADHSLEWISPSCQRILGWTPEEMYEMAPGALIHPDDAAAAEEPSRGDGAPARFRMRHREGRWVWVEVTTRPVLDELGRVVAHHSALRDVGVQVAAEQALRESEDRLRTLVGTMAEGVVLVHADGRPGIVNPAARAILGMDGDEVLARREWEVVREDGTPWPAEEQPLPHTMRTGEALRGVIGGRRLADGTTQWLRISTEPLIAEGAGGPHAVVATFADVTAEREADQVKRLVTEYASDILILHRPDWEFQWVSPSCERVMGWTPEEMMTHGPRALVHPDDDAVAHAEANAGVDLRRFRVRHRDGRWMWVESTSQPLFAPDGTLIGHQSVTRCVDEQVEAERALAASEERFRLLAGQASDIIVRHAPSGRPLDVSAAARRILGREPEDLIGLGGDHEIVHPEDAPALRAAFDRLRGGGGSETLLYRLRHADGHWVWLEGTHLALYGPGGEVTEVTSTLRDVGDRVAREREERRRAREREELMAVVSHELRAPLGTLEGMLTLALGDGAGLPGPARVGLESGLLRLARLRRLASDLMVMTQVDADALSLRRREVDLGDLVQDLAGGALGEAEREGVLVVVDARRVPVFADPERIGQVVDNLLANALKYSSSGGVVHIATGGDPTHGWIVVSDQGPGLPAEERARVFERFHRGPGADRVPGSGLGLAIAHAIVTAHGGTISLGDGPDACGLTATVRIPRE